LIRVCLFADTLLHDAGTEKLVAELVKRIDPESFEIHVCCLEASPRLQNLPSHIRTQVFAARVLYQPIALWQVWKFRRYLRQHQIDIAHGFMTKSNIFCVWAAWRSSCKAVVTSRLSTGYWYTPRLLALQRFLNRHTTRIFTNAVCAKKVTVEAEGVSPEKVYVVYTGVDLIRYSSSAGDLKCAAALGIPPGARVVGIVATFRPVKDLALFLRAAQIVVRNVEDAAFLLVGHGQLKPQLEKLGDELGIRERVFFSGGQGGVPDYLARMSVACLSSQSEGLPNAILEYMAAGLPVVATDVGGISELVRDGVTGFLVRDRAPDAFAAPVIRLLQDEDLRLRMAKAALKRAQTEFDIAMAARRLEDFYRDTLAQSTSAAEAIQISGE
jgi:L-malate glycosyltransferase